MNPIEKNCFKFKTNFHTAHREIKETGKITMEAAVYHQANLENDIIAHMSGLTFPYPPHDPECTPTPNPAPTIVPTVQPTPVTNVATYVSNILPQILTSMQQMQQLLIQIQTNQTGGGGPTSNRNICTLQAATETRQGQPHKPLPDFSNKYFWKHGMCAHEGVACNNKAPKNRDTSTFSNKCIGSTYVCT